MKRALIAFIAALLPATGFSADFDGSKKLVCALQKAVECSRQEGCEAGLPESILLPDFFQLDIKRKEISSERPGEEVNEARIDVVEKLDDRVVLLGEVDIRGWSAVLDRTTGRLTMSVTDSGYTFTLFGSCRPL